MQLRTTRRGVSLMHGRHVISEVLREPGPTHSVFDVLAALVPVLQVDAPVALLGFAGGGTVAALRALGVTHDVHAVDLSPQAPRLFRRLARRWAGATHFTQADAVVWLRRQRRRFGCIIDDLSIQVPGDVLKPDVSLTRLPELSARRLRTDGISVVNALPVPDLTWSSTQALLMAPYAAVRAVHFKRYENRILIGAAELPAPYELARRLQEMLERLGSRIQGGWSMHTLR